MLNEIRKNVSHPILKILLGLIIVVFIFFFGGGGGGQAPNNMASVNGDSISRGEYNKSYDGLVRFYEQITSQPITDALASQLGLRKRALDLVIDRVLLLQEAENRDIEVSEKELDDAIRAQEVFFEDGRYSKDRFVAVLFSNNVKVGDYRDQKRQELITNKLQQAIQSTAIVTEADISEEYLIRNTSMKVAYATFNPDDFSALAETTDERLRDFHAAEGEVFRTAEKRAARYLVFATTDYTGEVEVNEESLLDAYRVRAYSYYEPETVKARHILVKVDSSAEADMWIKAEEKALALKEKIEGGADFAKTAKKVSEDDGTRAAGGDLGTFQRGAMVPEFEKVAFTLQAGELSDPVRTSFGYHLIKVEEHKPARQKPLDAVRDALTGEIKKEKARELAYAAADNLLMDLEDGKTSWDALPEGLKVETTATVEPGQSDSSIPKLDKFTTAMFELPADSAGELIETSEGTYLVAIADYQASSIPPMEQIRAQVEARLRIVEGKRLAREAADKLAKESAEKGWNQALADSGAHAKESDTFTQGGGNIPPLGFSEQAKTALFDKPDVGSVLPTSFEIGSKFAVLSISELSLPDMAELDLERDAIRATLIPQKQEEAITRETERLRAEADIEISANFIP